MNRAIFTTKSGKEISKRLDEGAWYLNLSEAKTILDQTDDYTEFRLMGRFLNSREEVIAKRVKDTTQETNQ
tara:strand:+ start:432 stop:644 length:213 start_codon:yes stop_codon:yes gene_type:complete